MINQKYYKNIIEIFYIQIRKYDLYSKVAQKYQNKSVIYKAFLAYIFSNQINIQGLLYDFKAYFQSNEED